MNTKLIPSCLFVLLALSDGLELLAEDFDVVIVIEDVPVIGGMLANGVSNIDSYASESLSGVFEKFHLAELFH